MSGVFNIILNTYTIVILLIIVRYFVRQGDIKLLQNKIYMLMLKSNIILLVIDVFRRIEINPNSNLFFIKELGDFFTYMFAFVLPSLWAIFAYQYIFPQEAKAKKIIYPLLVLNIVHFIVNIFSKAFGWFYYYDENNAYQRGPLFMLPMATIAIMLLITTLIIYFNRKRIDNTNLSSLLLFSIPPFIGIISQIIFKGISLALPTMVLSLLIVFLSTQTRSMYMDYLTGVNNRKKLASYLDEKVSESSSKKTFSAIMIDLNHFKYINDTYGHNMGDEALRVSARLLESCLYKNDFIARYGGDEFCIVLDVSDEKCLEMIVQKIKDYFVKYNETSNLPYKLSMSMGYAVYDYSSFMSAEDFQKKIDKLMYINKYQENDI